jgi:hypothetical protein
MHASGNSESGDSFLGSMPKKNSSVELQQNRSVSSSVPGKGDTSNVTAERTQRLTDSVDKGLSSLSLSANVAAPFSHGSSRTLEQSSGFMNSQFLSNGPFMSQDKSAPVGGNALPTTDGAVIRSEPIFGLTSDSLLQKEAENFVAQWTGGDGVAGKLTSGFPGPQSRNVVPPQHQEAAPRAPPVLSDDQWYYRDPQGDIQGEMH